MKTLLEAVANEFEVPAEEIIGDRQDREFCDARKAYYYFLKEVMELPWWKITNITGRKIAMMDYNRQQCKILMESQFGFRKKIDALMTLHTDNQISMP